MLQKASISQQDWFQKWKLDINMSREWKCKLKKKLRNTFCLNTFSINNYKLITRLWFRNQLIKDIFNELTSTANPCLRIFHSWSILVHYFMIIAHKMLWVCWLLSKKHFDYYKSVFLKYCINTQAPYHIYYH